MAPAARYSLRTAWIVFSVAGGLAFILSIHRAFFAFALPLVLAMLGASVGRSRMTTAIVGATLGAVMGFACGAVVLVTVHLGGVFDRHEQLPSDVALAQYLRRELGTLTVFFAVLSVAVGITCGMLARMWQQTRDVAASEKSR